MQTDSTRSGESIQTGLLQLDTILKLHSGKPMHWKQLCNKSRQNQEHLMCVSEKALITKNTSQQS